MAQEIIRSRERSHSRGNETTPDEKNLRNDFDRAV
jgi:hypothetical protein